ncbi:MAG: molybdenum cofactor biosynthesis protein MoaE [Planctomycetota bacterium]
MVEAAVPENRVSIGWVQGPIESPLLPDTGSAGAMLTFQGVIRPYEDSRMLEGLDYSHYEPMATRQLQQLAIRAFQTYELVHIQITHSLGFVPIHQTSLHIVIASKHRKASLLAMDQVLDDLKRDVPIWKTPIFTDHAETNG